jgi:hypothetical protein
MTAAPSPEPYPSLEQLLEDARRRIQVTDTELAEARKRRDAIGAALLAEFPGSRVYVNGSVAHGDALTPLTDVDIGVVVAGVNGIYGPGLRGPGDLKQRAADAIRRELKEEYGDLRVEVEGRKRSILIRFRDPVARGLSDFTADVIVAIDNPTGAGLYIPRYDGWDRSHPERHTELVLAAIRASEVTYARVVRLLKHHSRGHDKPLCSWHLKALGLGCLTRPMPLVEGLLTFFRHAASELAKQDTPDPAGVAPHPIKTNVTRREAVRFLTEAAERLQRAVELEEAGYGILAHDELAKLFNDPEMLPRPDQNAVRIQEIARVAAEQKRQAKKVGAPALVTGVGAGAHRHRPNVRSWAP